MFICMFHFYFLLEKKQIKFSKEERVVVHWVSPRGKSSAGHTNGEETGDRSVKR